MHMEHMHMLYMHMRQMHMLCLHMKHMHMMQMHTLHQLHLKHMMHMMHMHMVLVEMPLFTLWTCRQGRGRDTRAWVSARSAYLLDGEVFGLFGGELRLGLGLLRGFFFHGLHLAAAFVAASDGSVELLVLRGREHRAAL